MDIISDKRKSMAALAVFRDLYNKNRDIYSAIAEFIKLAIVENGIQTFELQSIINSIKENNGIELPIAVVKRSLCRLNFLEKKGAQYTINPNVRFDADQILNATKREDHENQFIIEQLNDYCESKMGRGLSADEKTALCNEFCAFVVDDTNAPVFGAYISEFVIKKSIDRDFVEQLNQIRQGVLIFVAFNYNTDYNTFDKIDVPINIYLDTEILFHLYGLNGSLYKNLFDEFYNLVTEINSRAKKKVVRLLYFSESEDDVNSFFYVAEKIVRREEQLDPSKQAMRNIVNGCLEPSDIIEKKADFFRVLKEKDIVIDKQERYYDKEVNYQYLIDSKFFYENKEDGVTDYDIDRKVNLLNYISIKRGFKNQSIFKNIGHILLSANKITFSIAFDKRVRESNTVPLATNLTFLTNRFWISLNKGLTDISSLKSINIITRAQIALSTIINDSVGRLYNQYLEDDKNGKYDLEKSKACLAELHKSAVSPDELTIDKTEDYVDILNVNDIDAYIAEKEMIEAEMRSDNLRIKQTNQELQCKIDEDNKKNAIAIKKAAIEIKRSRNKTILDTYQTNIKKYRSEKKICVRGDYKKYRRHRVLIVLAYSFLIIALYVGTVILLQYKEVNIFCYILISVLELIAFAIPFIRPLVKYDRIAEAYKFCFFKKYRKEKLKSFISEYIVSNPKPEILLYSLEDIIRELKADY